jgi:hypothetical protein
MRHILKYLLVDNRGKKRRRVSQRTAVKPIMTARAARTDTPRAIRLIADS